ncbi:TRAP transporter substrate-binding protein [Nesterenkonia sp. PF2B19]|uniref:TRAP transporter substrate-binding protein n=1 Tax=unclassified Nesterenkonia TaxID=2629769 RepID=UPI0008732E65|nr:TRAP transporter substrate-binding protein [Nesterenkonia sp. PF2B19]OSM44017.1 C4-dicarboxylate ABC transporter [Nesterenkonia sp. PF2B19]
MNSTRTPIIISSVATVTLLLSACGGEAADGADAGQTLRLALNQSEDHPSYIALENFNDHLAENTEGWEIDVYPNETLGAQAEALQLVSDGSVDMAIVSGAQLENLNDDFMVFNLPRVFDDVDHQMDVIHDPEITGDLYASLEDSHSFTVLGGFTQGARSVYTTDGPIETPEDLSGQNLRIQESPINIAMAEALGGSATPMAYGELYTGLQSGVVDAAENNEVSYYTQGHYEVAPYWSYTNHLVGLDYLIINSDVLDSMSEEDRATFDEGWAAAHQEHTELWAEATEEAIAGAEAGGAEFSEVDDEAFDDELTAMVEEFITTDSQQELHDAARDAAE